MQELLNRIIEGQDMSSEECQDFLKGVIDGSLSSVQAGSILTALRMKGESSEEIAAFASFLRRDAISIAPSQKVVDTCGTGGDGQGTFNISTTAAFVVAGCGAYVAKHGNAAVSSSSGSADVLRALGVNIDLDPKEVERCIDHTNIGFMFAPLYHPAMKFIGPVRKELGIRTIFNLLGPLINPAGASHQVIGVARPEYQEKIAMALLAIGTEHSLVVHGDGLDEITISGPSKIYEVTSDIKSYTIDPTEFGLQKSDNSALTGGNAEENAEITTAILSGEISAKRDVVLINAAAALIAAGVAQDFKAGIALSRQSIDSGKAMKKLEALKVFTNDAGNHSK